MHRTTGPPPHFVNHLTNGCVEALATFPLDDRLLIAAAGDNDVWLWSLPDNFSEGRLAVPEHRLRAMVLAELNGEPVAIGGAGDVIRLWDVSFKARWGDELARHPAGVYVLAVTDIAGSVAVISGGGDGTLRIWNISDGQAIAPPVPVHKPRVRALAVADVAGRVIAISGGDDGVVTLTDLEAATIIERELGRHDGPVFALDVAVIDEHVLAISGGADGYANIHDLIDRERVWPSFAHSWASDRYLYVEQHQAGVLALATTEFDGRAVAISGADDGMLRIWDLLEGELVCGPITGHEGPVTAVVASRLQGRPIFCSGDEAGSVLSWDLGSRDAAPIGPWARSVGLDLPDPRPYGQS